MFTFCLSLLILHVLIFRTSRMFVLIKLPDGYDVCQRQYLQLDETGYYFKRNGGKVHVNIVATNGILLVPSVCEIYKYTYFLDNENILVDIKEKKNRNLPYVG
jgi:hypothetical protein